MEKKGLNELRRMFLDFYNSKGHYEQKSFSLVPRNDKSLLLINSGMAPLKPFFAGIETPPSKRMTTCQKCIRTGDIDNVGYTARHATFFEMMGSFSFGEYFKKESIEWGWEFITQVLKMPEDKVWATIYLDDDEAFHLWRDMIGMPEERIVRLGKEDNFWEIGTGPCGPCSELYFDRGESFGCGKSDCKPGCDCDRYVEFWNHVFTQFNREEDGTYTPLAHPNIDTGMGLERLACIMQDVDSIFDIDTFRFILDEVVRLSGVAYEYGTVKTDVSIRIITDHIRSVTFLIGDGVIPSNEGRGYVMRRLLRRAARHGRLLGIKGAFLAELSKKVIESSREAYPELAEKEGYIHKILTVEEEKFSTTIDQGTTIINDYIEELMSKGEKTLSGEKVFKLYDTFGFPMELTQEILEEKGCSADIDSFYAHMEQQKKTARAARKNDNDAAWAEESVEYASQEPTVFTGYDCVESDTVVTGLFGEKSKLSEVAEGQTAIAILAETPFYAESGGQAGDTGILSNDRFTAEVLSVTKNQGVFAHKIRLTSGILSAGDSVHAEINVINRNNTARNHTATHLLHRALKQIVGEHVDQAGSSVSADSLRFDFTHFEGVSQENLQRLEQLVNEKINEFLPVQTEVLAIEDAQKTGATSLFGEKYGKEVRVVSVGSFSKEFCGGTHVANSGQIGAFRILSENGVAAGVRRIEAVTGAGLYRRLTDHEALVHAVSDQLKTKPAGLTAKIASLQEEMKKVKKELDEMKMKEMGGSLDQMIKAAPVINGVTLICEKFQDKEINDLRRLSDEIKALGQSTIVVFASENAGKVTFMVSVADSLLEKGHHAGNMIKKIAAAAGGGGGGKADMAQAGAKDPSKIDEAFAVAAEILK